MNAYCDGSQCVCDPGYFLNSLNKCQNFNNCPPGYANGAGALACVLTPTPTTAIVSDLDTSFEIPFLALPGYFAGLTEVKISATATSLQAQQFSTAIVEIKPAEQKIVYTLPAKKNGIQTFIGLDSFSYYLVNGNGRGDSATNLIYILVGSTTAYIKLLLNPPTMIYRVSPSDPNLVTTLCGYFDMRLMSTVSSLSITYYGFDIAVYPSPVDSRLVFQCRYRVNSFYPPYPAKQPTTVARVYYKCDFVDDDHAIPTGQLDTNFQYRISDTLSAQPSFSDMNRNPLLAGPDPQNWQFFFSMIGGRDVDVVEYRPVVSALSRTAACPAV